MQVTTVDRIKARRLRWFGHVLRMDRDRIPYLALHRMVDGVHSRGRQSARWRGGVMQDIKEWRLEFSGATSITKDRDGWRQLLGPVVTVVRTDWTDDDDDDNDDILWILIGWYIRNISCKQLNLLSLFVPWSWLFYVLVLCFVFLSIVHFVRSRFCNICRSPTGHWPFTANKYRNYY